MERNSERIIAEARDAILNFNQLQFPVCETHMCKKLAFNLKKKEFACKECDPDSKLASYIVNEKLKQI